MKKQQYDPGLGSGFNPKTGRVLHSDGQFNVERVGQRLDLRDMFQHLVNMSWKKFIGYLLTYFIFGNAIFACLYVLVGIEGLQGAQTGSFWLEFKQAFFFSVQTCATVGYGHLAPASDACNILAATETLIGLLALSVATGLFYGRFSRPHSSIVYSKKALIAPFQEFKSFQFKMVNRRADLLADLEARLMLVMTNPADAVPKMNYYSLKLEIDQVAFMPLTWTLVHVITTESPLFEKSKADLILANAEFIIQLKGFDETFSQTIYSRFSYTAHDLVLNARYKPSFSVPSDGPTLLKVDTIDEYELLPQ